MKTELKPCPFCGWGARAYFGEHDMHGVVCNYCNAKVYGYGSETAAKRAWNRRKPRDFMKEFEQENKR